MLRKLARFILGRDHAVDTLSSSNTPPRSVSGKPLTKLNAPAPPSGDRKRADSKEPGADTRAGRQKRHGDLRTLPDSLKKLDLSQARVIPRTEHNISRRDISPNALKVLYRLNDAGYQAFLVGGSVRDLLLGGRPKEDR